MKIVDISSTLTERWDKKDLQVPRSPLYDYEGGDLDSHLGWGGAGGGVRADKCGAVPWLVLKAI